MAQCPLKNMTLHKHKTHYCSQNPCSPMDRRDFDVPSTLAQHRLHNELLQGIYHIVVFLLAHKYPYYVVNICPNYVPFALPLHYHNHTTTDITTTPTPQPILPLEPHHSEHNHHYHTTTNINTKTTLQPRSNIST